MKWWQRLHTLSTGIVLKVFEHSDTIGLSLDAYSAIRSGGAPFTIGARQPRDFRSPSWNLNKFGNHDYYFQSFVSRLGG